MSLLADLLEQTPVPQAAREVGSFGSRQPDKPDVQAAASANRVVELHQPIRRPRHTPPHSSAATATPEWRHARDGYINHLMTCRSCYAPTARYCRLGADLRATYEATPMETLR